jgi:RNA polymerase sigma-70 factor (ECF subfamily)
MWETFMPRVPETRASLILRLPTTTDAAAWREFVAIYEPFVYRFVRRGGMQDADARDLVQNVFLSVARAVGRWQPDRGRARFRTWLFRIARNQLIDVLYKRKLQSQACGGTTALHLLNQQLALDNWSTDEVMQSHRRELFRLAADRVKDSVKPETWQAFWLTAVELKPIEQTASCLNLSVGAVYIARSRVLARLRDEIKQWEDDDAM